MFGSTLRCPVCNQYAPDRCTCKKDIKMKITNANGVEGMLLNPYHKDGKWVFRVYRNGTFTDYALRHSDLRVIINDDDAFFYEDEHGEATINHNSVTLGIKGDNNV